ncbi:hypothetical protein [Allohahella sp. A8]|uniref:hypothetical protein n=1 Tax=Allohahella sp. A8 TaxID=3141461 RepID=UPI003A812647
MTGGSITYRAAFDSATTARPSRNTTVTTMNGSKPLLKSKATISAAVALLATLFALQGIEIDELAQEQIVAGVVALTGLIGTVWARYVAHEEIKGIIKTPAEPTE